MTLTGTRSTRTFRWVIAVVAIAIFVAIGVYIEQFLVQTKGTSFDFYLMWRGANEFWQGRNPYTDQMAEQIQIATIGHVAGPAENQYRFVYPVYLAYLLFPLPLLPWNNAIALWLILQPVYLVVTLGLLLKVVSWKPRPVIFALLVALWVGSRYTLIIFVLGQNSILILLLLAVAGYASWRGFEEGAAIALALASVKFQVALLPILGWLALMLFRQQWRALLWFGMVMLILVILPVPTLGNWIAGLVSQASLYWSYNASYSTLSYIVTLGAPDWRLPFMVVGFISGIAYWLRVIWRQRATTQRTGTLTVLAFSVLLTLLVIPLSSVYDITLALLPGLIAWRMIDVRTDWLARVMQILILCLPILSWGIITFVPLLFDAVHLAYDAVGTDKILIPGLLAVAFIYAERKLPARHALQR